ncbi:Uncharacterized protein GBIM_06009, partial [Gryllus bimaculatus]
YHYEDEDRQPPTFCSLLSIALRGNLRVSCSLPAALPREAPYIEGVASAYSLGEWVTANCTSDKSSPPAQLSWYINGAKAEQWLLDQMPLAADGDFTKTTVSVAAWLQTRAPRTHTVDERGLHTSSLGLRFVAERRFFQGSPARCPVEAIDLVSKGKCSGVFEKNVFKFQKNDYFVLKLYIIL